MEAIPWQITLYGSMACGLLFYIALTLRGIDKRLETFHNNVWTHIYKDRL